MTAFLIGCAFTVVAAAILYFASSPKLDASVRFVCFAMWALYMACAGWLWVHPPGFESKGGVLFLWLFISVSPWVVGMAFKSEA
jgi:hypothetical protein